MKFEFNYVVLFFLLVTILLVPTASFVPPKGKTCSTSTMLSSVVSASMFYDPTTRDEAYGQNIAKYLVDLHDNKGTFDFCGGMMFQFRLTKKLRDRLVRVAGGDDGEQVRETLLASALHIFSTYLLTLARQFRSLLAACRPRCCLFHHGQDPRLREVSHRRQCPLLPRSGDPLGPRRCWRSRVCLGAE